MDDPGTIIVFCTVLFIALLAVLWFVDCCLHSWEPFRCCHDTRVHDIVIGHPPQGPVREGAGVGAPTLALGRITPTSVRSRLSPTSTPTPTPTPAPAPRDLGLVYGHDCPICLEHMDGRDTIGRIDGCRHAFHRSCITHWYHTRAANSQHINCPVCQRPSENSLILTKVVTA